MVPRTSLVAILIIACSLSCVVEAFKVVQGDKNVVLLDLTLVNGTTISSIELASSYAWISRVMTDPKEEFTANIIALDVPEDVPCSIANPRAVTEGQIGIVRITRRTTRQNYVNTCSSFQLVAAAQRENAMQAVILIRNDSRLNNEYEAGNFLAGTTYAIFTEQKAFDTIIELYGGEQNIMRMAAKILVAPDDVIAPWQEHVVRVRSMAAVATVLSGISLIWAVILLPFRQKYYPLNSKTLLVFLTFIGIIILAAPNGKITIEITNFLIVRVAVYPVDFRGYQAVYTSLGFQFIVFAGDTMVALVFSVVVVAWLEISLWKSKKRVSRILRICCLALNLALLICLFVTVIIDSIDPTLGAVSAGNIILAVFLLIIVIGFMVAGGRLLHLMKKIKDSKTERDGKDKVLKKKIAIVLTVIGVIGFYAVAANIIANLLPLNADINMGIEFSLRFAENIALWIMLWFFTDSIVHHIDSSRGSISSGKAKSAMSSRKINTSTGVVAGTSTLPSQGEIENHKSSTNDEE